MVQNVISTSDASRVYPVTVLSVKEYASKIADETKQKQKVAEEFAKYLNDNYNTQK